MALETGTYISDLNSSNPDGATSQVSELDGHVKLLKSTVKATFPNVSGAVTATHTELNYVDGVTSNVQTQLNTLSAGQNGSWKFLKAVTAASSSSVTFVNGVSSVVFDSTYDEYQVVFHAVKPASDAILYLRTSSNAGVSYDSGASDYSYAVSGRGSAGSTSSSDSGGAAQIRITGASVESTREGAFGRVTIFRPFDAAYTTVLYAAAYHDSVNGVAFQNGAGARLSAADVDGIQFLFSTGNIASGYFYLYGRKGQ